MIVRETLLRELFSQLPDMVVGSKSYSIKFHWGGQDDMNLYMQTENGNTTPIVWLVQEKAKQKSTEQSSRVKLILGKSSPSKNARNPTVWDSEFSNYLNPLLENVLKCLKQSGRTFIIGNEYDVYREANYSEYARTIDGKTDTSTLTIDHWNVITLEADIMFIESTMCIQQINFN